MNHHANHRTGHLPARPRTADVATSPGADMVYLYQQSLAATGTGMGVGGGLTLLTPAEAAARQEHDRILYARWLARHNARTERDRKARRFWLAFGAVFGLGVLAACGGVGWMLYRALTDAAANVGGVLILAALAVLALPALAVGGHKCVTIVQHRH